MLERARKVGVHQLIVPGIDLETSRSAVDIAEGAEGIYAAVGVHPHSASSYSTEAKETLQELALSPSVVAIGEIGLDFIGTFPPTINRLRH